MDAEDGAWPPPAPSGTRVFENFKDGAGGQLKVLAACEGEEGLARVQNGRESHRKPSAGSSGSRRSWGAAAPRSQGSDVRINT